MKLGKAIFSTVLKIIKEDRQSILHLFFYSAVEAILILSIPLASSFVINSVLAHAEISVFVLGAIVLTLFILITVLQVIKEYIIEKFQQKIFLQTGIEIAALATNPPVHTQTRDDTHAKFMNYFFDITAIQKFFPILLLDGVGLAIKILVSLLLLLAFDPVLFSIGFIFFVGYILLIVLLGRNVVERAIGRSDAKHGAIYYLQHIREHPGTREQILTTFDGHLSNYALARQGVFEVTIRQMALTFFAEGFVFSTFLIAGGYLVINGTLPLGEFIAAEIVVVSITNALKGFVKQFDYIYDTLEGFYKVNKLSAKLHGEHDG